METIKFSKKQVAEFERQINIIRHKQDIVDYFASVSFLKYDDDNISVEMDHYISLNYYFDMDSSNDGKIVYWNHKRKIKHSHNESARIYP
jgi:hypothetical protein